MKPSPRFSVIVPVFNRPGEIEELLASLESQSYRNFEVIVVEDGSSLRCENAVLAYNSTFHVSYLEIPNGGPGPARNAGAARAHGEYLIFLDSDCLVPDGYFHALEAAIVQIGGKDQRPVFAWGGPDAGHPSFTPLQQAMAYTMSSVLTTGGIRGKKNAATSFQPRSFNMGMHRNIMKATGGFRFTHSAEDIELSIRMREAGFRVELIVDAFVYHKRRTTLNQFFRQVRQFGKGRVMVSRAHPGTLKLAHWFPLVFMVGVLIIPGVSLLDIRMTYLMTAGYLGYSVLVGIGAAIRAGSFYVGLLAIPSVWIQFSGYAVGFASGWKRDS